MYIVYGIILAAVFFAVQLFLCLKVKPLAVRLIPTLISAVVLIYYIVDSFGAFAWYLSAPEGEVAGTVFSLDFLWFLVVYALMFLNRALFICFGIGMAWAVSVLVNYRKKTL